MKQNDVFKLHQKCANGNKEALDLVWGHSLIVRDIALPLADNLIGKGIKINKDICFVSYANLPITSYLDTPPAASVEQFPHQQAEKAAEILFQLIDTKPDEDIPHKVILESEVVVNR